MVTKVKVIDWYPIIVGKLFPSVPVRATSHTQDTVVTLQDSDVENERHKANQKENMLPAVNVDEVFNNIRDRKYQMKLFPKDRDIKTITVKKMVNVKNKIFTLETEEGELKLDIRTFFILGSKNRVLSINFIGEEVTTRICCPDDEMVKEIKLLRSKMKAEDIFKKFKANTTVFTDLGALKTKLLINMSDGSIKAMVRCKTARSRVVCHFMEHSEIALSQYGRITVDDIEGEPYAFRLSNTKMGIFNRIRRNIIKNESQKYKRGTIGSFEYESGVDDNMTLNVKRDGSVYVRENIYTMPLGEEIVCASSEGADLTVSTPTKQMTFTLKNGDATKAAKMIREKTKNTRE